MSGAKTTFVFHIFTNWLSGTSLPLLALATSLPLLALGAIVAGGREAEGGENAAAADG